MRAENSNMSETNDLDGVMEEDTKAPQCHQPKLQPCPRQAPRSSQPPWPSGDDQASAAQSGGLAGLAVM